MIHKLIILPALVFSFYVFFFGANLAIAQTCGGGITCYQSCSTVCSLPCSSNPAICCGTTSLNCTGLTTNVGCVGATCSFVGNQGICDQNGIVSSGNCYVIPPSTPTPPGPTPPPSGWGACGSCAGCPGGNNTQCRTDPGGACVWDPSGCGGGGGGGCSMEWQSFPPLAVVGQSTYIRAFSRGTLSNWTQGMTANGTNIAIPALGATIEGRFTPSRPITHTIRAWTELDWLNPQTRCEGSRLLYVQPANLPVEAWLTFNGSTGDVYVPQGSTGSLKWDSYNASSCTRSWTTGSAAGFGLQSSSAINSTTVFSVTCTNTIGGSATASVRVIPQSTTPPSVILTANNQSPLLTISAPTTVTLRWTSRNATSCTASGNWSGAKTPVANGSESQGSVGSSQSYTLTCTGPGGTVSSTVNVFRMGPTPTPTVAPPTLPVVDLRANNSQGPLSISSGSTATLSWTIGGNVTSCSATGSWAGSKSTSGGTELTSVINSNRSYTLTCTGPGGTGSDTVDVNVTGLPPLPSISISASPNTLPAGGGNSTLTWTSTNSTSCSPSLGWSGAISVSGSRLISGITSSTNFGISCTGPGGTANSSAGVIVSGVGQCSPAAPRDPAEPLCAPNPPTQNGSITWTWPVVPLATEYLFQVVDDTTGNIISGTLTGWQNGQSYFYCRPNTSDICSITTDLSPGRYRSQIQARNLGTGGCNVSAVATYPSPPTPGIEVATCSATAWWQVRGSDIVSQGNIQSRIPASCVGPVCISRLIASSVSGSNDGGVLLRGNVLDIGAGSVSANNWDAEISLLGRQPRYADFVTLIPSSVTVSDPGANPSSSAITSPPGSSLSGGYYWLRRSGDVRISQPVVIPSGTRVILFVDGVANIDEDISFANIDNSFFMIVARNGIRVGTNPDTIQGIFYTEGGFDSGTGSNPLAVTGSTTALGGVSLGRDLGVANRTSPAEVFTLSPELLLNYPQTLTFKRPLWQEVAP